MDATTTPPQCPQCGFTIFNRRYPKCERCRCVLPNDLVLSQAERIDALARDSQNDDLLAQRLTREALRPWLIGYSLAEQVLNLAISPLRR